MREPRFAACSDGQNRLLSVGSLKDYKPVVSLGVHLVQNNLYFPLDASVTLFPCLPMGLLSFTLGRICWKAIPGALGTRHAASVVLPAPAELQGCGLEIRLNCGLLLGSTKSLN